ncbi:MAG: hypothetical protein IT376_19360 [Polyangiaceae bacterium]|nr:hypothetical protein [Polyangiaceae bacterium]
MFDNLFGILGPFTSCLVLLALLTPALAVGFWQTTAAAGLPGPGSGTRARLPPLARWRARGRRRLRDAGRLLARVERAMMRPCELPRWPG